MQKLTVNLWFDNNAEDAAKCYPSIFEGGTIDTITYYGAAGAEVSGMEEKTIQTVTFTLDGQQYTGINGGPVYKLTPAFSLQVLCKDQAEIDYYWEKLGENGEYIACGWLTDQFGVSWQIVPEILFQLLNDPDPVKTEKVNQAMFEMVKLDIEELQKAFHS